MRKGVVLLGFTHLFLARKGWSFLDGKIDQQMENNATFNSDQFSQRRL